MPRFYFDSANGDATSRDEDGLDLPTIACAKTEAVATLKDLARECERDGGGFTIESRVRTETGRVVFQATLSLRTEDVLENGCQAPASAPASCPRDVAISLD